jgi:hypothetical protein
MRIKMKMSVLGTFHEMENVKLGDVVDVPDDEGARYCKLGYAEPVAEMPRAETATAPEPEKRAPGARRPGRPRKTT